jgi:exoribonuclease R
LSTQPSEEEITRWKKRASEFFAFLHEYLGKCNTIQELLEAIGLLHGFITEEGLLRAAYLGAASQEFKQWLEAQIERRKMKDIGVR